MSIILAFVALGSAVPAATKQDERAVTATVQSFFDALAARDQKKILDLVVAKGSISGHGERAGKAQSFTDSWPAWVTDLGQGKERLDERMQNPEVRIRGNMASVWSAYTFHIDGKFSHCGYDHFDLARLAGKWRIVNLSFTVEKTGCPK
ncbi:MAG TPA: nuclear transport factor 2 family protein [Sphingomicrobium sp.]|jgi:hypothetical protein